ncbi:MAG: molybdenum cofactor biosynthesis protein B [Lentisphaerales bacterium]|nr:molybdenum cofactor biosynthesis protein B [Lentisphaerales bacterium]
MSQEREFIPLKIAVLKVSDTRTEATDDVGKMLGEIISAEGHEFHEKVIVPDCKYKIRAAVSKWLAEEEVNVVISTGGTGVTGRDGTPEAVVPLLDKVIDGFGELFRMKSYELIKTSTIQSRCLAGGANGIYVFCLPGSKGACKDGWSIIREQLDHTTRPCNLVQLMPRLKEK